MSDKISPNSVTFLRFAFAIPMVVIYMLVLIFVGDLHLGQLSSHFWYFLIVIVFAQIIANTLLVYLFNFEFFAVSVAFSKMEVIFVALWGMMFFATEISLFGWILIFVSILGVMILSIPKFNLTSIKKLSIKPILLGISSGLFFSITTVSIREATASIVGGDLFFNVAFVLIMSLICQSFILFIYIWFQDREDFRAIFYHKYKSFSVGITAALGSICWFSAYSLISPALVKTIGSVEMVFTVLIGYMFFQDRLSIYEYIGMFIIVCASLGVLYA